MQRSEFSIEDISRGRTMTYSDLAEIGGHVFECNKVRADAVAHPLPV
jgi:alkylated DNA nucleotide flippase Atl1